MLDILKEIIIDNQGAPVDTGVPRHLRVTTVPGKATVCMGVRRCGKSTFLFQQMQRLMKQGVSRRNFLILDFFDDRLHRLHEAGLSTVLDAYFALHPEVKGAETLHCFFDEIQAVPGWEPFVDRVMRTEKCQVYLTGSSARMLSREIATQMRGRALSWELFPFSFSEYLDYLGVDGSLPHSSRRRVAVQSACDKYWETGGFPEVAALPAPVRIRIHQEYLQAILFRDLVERHDVSHPRAVSDLAHWLVDNTASLYTVNRLTGYLKSLGHSVPKASVSDYLGWFEDAYFLFTVKLFDASVARQNTNPKKVYCVDHALVRSTASGVLTNSGHLLENLVFTHLRRATPVISYYRTRTGREVDFVATLSGGQRRLVQVCESLAAPETRKREVSALAQAMEELDLPEGTIVTRHETEVMDRPAGRIRVQPAWRFLLSGEAETN